MLTWRPLIVATAVPLTRLLMNGAAGFWKICCWPPENWLVGCVQFSFSSAITNTVLIEPALRPSSAAAPVTMTAAVRHPKSIGYFILYPLSCPRERHAVCATVTSKDGINRGTIGRLCNKNKTLRGRPHALRAHENRAIHGARLRQVSRVYQP